LVVDGGDCFRHGLVRLGGLDDGAVGPNGCSGDQGEREGIAWPGVNFGGALGAVDHDHCVVGAFGEAVDADLAHVAAEGLDQPGGQVGTERAGELGPWPRRRRAISMAVSRPIQIGRRRLLSGSWSRTTWWSRPDWMTRRTSLTGMSRKSRSVAVGMRFSFAQPGENDGLLV
jgi:hypothetical protein